MKTLIALLIVSLLVAYGCEEDEFYATEFHSVPHTYENDTFETIAAYDTYVVVSSTNKQNRTFDVQIGYRNDHDYYTENHYIFTGTHMIINLKTPFDYVWIVSVDCLDED